MSMRIRAIILLAAVVAGPAAAQGVAGPRLNDVRPLKPTPVTADPANPEAPVNGVVILYGNQKCPTNAAGEEVVVCARRGAAEQFRIPRELRDGTLKPEYQTFAQRGQALTDMTRTGIGTCQTTGAGGAAGCSLSEYSAWKKQKDAQKDADKRKP